MTTGYTPIYRIMKDNEDITGNFNDRTLQIRVDLQAGDGNDDQCTIIVDDRDWRVVRPLNGDVIGIWLGYVEVGMAYMGSFELSDITFLGPPRQIKLLGKSTGTNDIQKAPAIREFDNKSVGDILGQMAGQTGLGLSISGDLSGFKIPFKNQGNVSNLHLLNELERLTGAVAKVVDGKLMFIKRDGGETASGVALPTLVLLPEHFGTWEVRYTSKPGYGQVKASWFDKDEMVRKWVGAGITSGDGVGLANKFGGAFNIGQLFNSQEEAQRAAQSQAENFQRAEVTAKFDLAKGDPWIRDQQTLLVTGMRDAINGSYVISKATHTYIKSTGIKSEFECKLPGTGVDYAEASTEFMRPGPGELLGEYLRTHPNVNPGDLSQDDINAINQGGFVQ